MTDVLLAVRPNGAEAVVEPRAFSLARSHGGRVRVVTVRERGEIDIEAERARLAARHPPETLADWVVREGAPWEAILKEARSYDCDLIVIGPGGRHADVQEVLFGDTAERLAHRASQPVLIVRRPAPDPYGHAVIATDFSEGSRIAALAAARLLPDARLTLLHACRLPFQGFLSDPRNAREFEAQAREHMDAFLAAGEWPASVRGRISPRIVDGAPEEAILKHIEEDPADLVVLGAHGQTGPLEKLLGGTAERLMKALPTDVMLVREPR